MAKTQSLKVLLVAEGSGGHFIPALQVARALTDAGAQVKVWYAQRRQLAPLASALAEESKQAAVDVQPIPLAASSGMLARVWQCRYLWSLAQRCFDVFAPDVVVGFGGWVSAPVVLAARRRSIRCVLHEQNAVMGRTNRFLSRWVDRVALSFRDTEGVLDRLSTVMTGLPIRAAIGTSSRAQTAEQFGFDAQRPTLLILGGSQGSRTINQLVVCMVGLLSPEERAVWQVLHVTGAADEPMVRGTYAAMGVTAWVAPFLIDMDAAYAQADLVIARAGASTIAELARCGKPAVLIPYPYAGGHQWANAKQVEASGGGLMIEEVHATPERLSAAARRILSDHRLRAMMGTQMRALGCADAAQRLAHEILAVNQQHNHWVGVVEEASSALEDVASHP